MTQEVSLFACAVEALLQDLPAGRAGGNAPDWQKIGQGRRHPSGRRIGLSVADKGKKKHWCNHKRSIDPFEAFGQPEGRFQPGQLAGSGGQVASGSL